MRTFIIANLKSGALLYFHTPYSDRDFPKTIKDMVGYIPGDIDDLRLISVPDVLSIGQARDMGMRYDDAKKMIIDKDENGLSIEEVKP